LPAALLPRWPQPRRAARTAPPGPDPTGRPAPEVLTELVGPILDRATTVEQAIAECGTAPVTRASGKTKTVSFRWAANHQARITLHTFADNSRHASPWAAKLYADARRRGKHHPHAIRILARAWLRVMWACWHNNTAYNPAKHRAEQRLAA
jgi:hypothetical protein